MSSPGTQHSVAPGAAREEARVPSTSNQLGEFRAGLSAAYLGAVPAVLIGGLGSILVAGLWIYLFPALRGIRSLDG